MLPLVCYSFCSSIFLFLFLCFYVFSIEIHAASAKLKPTTNLFQHQNRLKREPNKTHTHTHTTWINEREGRVKKQACDAKTAKKSKRNLNDGERKFLGRFACEICNKSNPLRSASSLKSTDIMPISASSNTRINYIRGKSKLMPI